MHRIRVTPLHTSPPPRGFGEGQWVEGLDRSLAVEGLSWEDNHGIEPWREGDCRLGSISCRRANNVGFTIAAKQDLCRRGFTFQSQLVGPDGLTILPWGELPGWVGWVPPKASKTSPIQRAALLSEYAQALGQIEGWGEMGSWLNRLSLGTHVDGLGVGAWVILSAPSKELERVGRITAWNWSRHQTLYVEVDVWVGQWRQNSTTSGWEIWEEGKGAKHRPGTWPSPNTSGSGLWYPARSARRIWAGEAGIVFEEGSRRRREIWVRLDNQGDPLTITGIQAPSTTVSTAPPPVLNLVSPAMQGHRTQPIKSVCRGRPIPPTTQTTPVPINPNSVWPTGLSQSNNAWRPPTKKTWRFDSWDWDHQSQTEIEAGWAAIDHISCEDGSASRALQAKFKNQD